MNYFLAKTDPATYSIDDLKKDGTTIWDGVKNYAALKALKSWKPGDRVFVYHSQGENNIQGMMEVTGFPEPDCKDEKGISWVCEVKFLEKFEPSNMVTLKEIKANPEFQDFALVRQSRLSVMLCPKNFVEWMREKKII